MKDCFLAMSAFVLATFIITIYFPFIFKLLDLSMNFFWIKINKKGGMEVFYA